MSNWLIKLLVRLKLFSQIVINEATGEMLLIKMNFSSLISVKITIHNCQQIGIVNKKLKNQDMVKCQKRKIKITKNLKILIIQKIILMNKTKK